ncbi:hypothetical protein JHK84_035299 [Glycine max]|nr:hypothetical protein JHK84_035299 [Glycine max]
MAEEPGSFKKFANCVGVHIVSELRAMQERMESSQLKTYNLTESDMLLNEVA